MKKQINKSGNQSSKAAMPKRKKPAGGARDKKPKPLKKPSKIISEKKELPSKTKKHSPETNRNYFNTEFRKMLESTHDIVWEVDDKANCTYISDSVERLLGIKPSEMIGKPPFNFVSEDEAAETEIFLNDVFKKGIPFAKLENSVVSKNGEEVFFEVSGIPVLDSKGKTVGFYGFGNNITDKRRAEKLLIESEETLRNMIDFSPMGLAIISISGRLLRVNKAFGDILGYTETELASKSFMDISHPDELKVDLENTNKLISGEVEIVSREKRYIHKNGNVVWTVISVSLVRNDKNVPLYYISQIKDISERKKYEEQLIIKDYAIESSLSAIGLAEMDGKVSYVNEAFLKFWKYNDAAEVIGKHISEFSSSSDMMERVMPYLKQGKGYSGEGKGIRKDGSMFNMFVSVNIVRNKDGRPVCLMASFMDTTLVKQSEEALKESEKKYRLIAENSTDVIWVYDLTDSKLIYMSPSVERLRGIKAEDVMANQVENIMTKESWERLQMMIPEKVKKYLNGEHEINVVEIEQRHADGSVIYTEINTHFETDEDSGNILVYGSSRNITDRKKSDMLLEASEKRFRELAENSPAIIYRISLFPEFKFEYVSPAVTKIMGYTPEEHYTNPDLIRNSIHPEDRNMLIEINSIHIDKPVTLRWYRKDGKLIWTELRNTLITDDGGKPIAVEGMSLDITEKKLAEDALRESEERFQSAFDYAAIGISLTSRDGRLIKVNRSLCNILGYTEEELLSRTFMDLTYPDDIKIDVDNSAKLLSGEIDSYQLEKRYIHKDGHLIWVLLSVSLVHDEDGKPRFFISQVQDISSQIELKKTQEELTKQIQFHASELEKEVKERTKELEHLYSFNSAVIDSAGITIISTAKDGTIVTFNPAAETMLGFKASEVVNKLSVLDLYDKEEIRNKLNEYGIEIKAGDKFDFAKFLEQVLVHRPASFEWTLIRKDGSRVPVIISLKILKDANGESFGYVGVAVDISKRKEAEEALRKSEQRFQNMFRSHDAIMLLINPETGIIVEANKAAEKFYGYKFSEQNNLTIQQINLLTEEQILEEMNTARAEKKNYFVFPHKLASGDIRYVEVHSSPVEITGEILLFSIIHDITERKQAEEALKISEAENRAIVRAVPDLMFRLKKDGTYIDSYHKEDSPYYVPPEFFIGKKISETLPPEIAKQSMEALVKSFESSEQASFEYELLMNNEMKYFECRVISISDDEALSIVREITQRKIAEKALLESEKNYRRLHESLMDGYVQVDLKGNILKCNDTYLKITGYNFDDLQNISYEKITPEKWHKAEQAILDTQLYKRGYTDVYEKEYIRKDGSICNIELRAFILKNDKGESEGSWAIVRDITGRKKIEEALKLQSEAFEALSVAVVITSVEGIIQWTNSAFTKLTGYSPNEAIGKDTRLLKSGMHNDHFYKELWDSILHGQVWRNEFINKRKDGTVYYEDNTITPVFDAYGNITNFIAIKFDITEKKEMENALRESEERWQFALEGSGDGVWDWDVESNIIYVSPQWKRMLGYDSDELIQNFNDVENLIHPDDREKNIQSIEKYFRGENALYVNEHRVLCKDGAYKWVLVRGKILNRDKANNPLRIIGTQADITNRKKFEEQLLSNLEKEKELNDLKSRFVSTASHEFRTPLASILLISDVLISYWEKYEKTLIESKLKTIKERVLFLTDIVDNVLQVSKIQEGKIEFKPEEIDLVDFCKSSIDSFNVNESLKNKIQFSSKYKSLTAIIDLRLMNQILDNLISNAIKYTPENPHIIITLRKENEEVIISVEDNGIGIPEEDRKHIFDAFYRAANAKNFQGNGLGLNIIKESLINQGGDITFSSITGKGTTFKVHLPVNKFIKQ